MPTQTDKPTVSLHLTQRDRDILCHVFTFRVLAADQIQQLTEGSNQQILRRLQALTAHHYLIRHQRSSAHIPYLYQVTSKAAEELTPLYGIEPERVKKRAQKVAADKLQHALMMSRLQYAVTRAAAMRPDVELADCILEDELPAHSVTYQAGPRVIKTAIRHDILFMLKYQERYLVLPAEADRSTERGQIIAAKIAAYEQLWQQEREKSRRGEKSLWPFRVLWTTKSRERLESIRQHVKALNGGKGTGLHWFTTEDSYADSQRFFESIWKTGRTGDDTLHGLLESRERDRDGK